MNNQLIISVIISVIYFIIKFIEMRFIVKENKSLKSLITDSLIVFVSSMITLVLIEQFNLNDIIGNKTTPPEVFVSNPDF